jgi:hypothetical protein
MSDAWVVLTGLYTLLALFGGVLAVATTDDDTHNYLVFVVGAGLWPVVTALIIADMHWAVMSLKRDGGK